jgi:hypothetical protein
MDRRNDTMPQSVALPFTIRRSDDIIDRGRITQTTETVHGLLHLAGETLTIEWRLYRETGHVGSEIRTDREVDAVRTVAVPIRRVGGAHVQRGGWPWPFKPRLVLTAADLQAFEAIAGVEGLRLEHPAELVLTLRRSDHLLAEEFAAELALAIAQAGVAAEASRQIGAPTPPLIRKSS